MTRSLEPWIAKSDDAAIPDRVRLRVFEGTKGRCAKCTRVLRPGQWACDHIVALANGGRHAEDNLQPLCVSPCHSDKTRDDMAGKSRTYRKRKADLGIKRKRSITRWRRFDGSIREAGRER